MAIMENRIEALAERLIVLEHHISKIDKLNSVKVRRTKVIAAAAVLSTIVLIRDNYKLNKRNKELEKENLVKPVVFNEDNSNVVIEQVE